MGGRGRFGLYRVSCVKFGLLWPRLRRGAGRLLQVFEAAAVDSMGSAGLRAKKKGPTCAGSKLAMMQLALLSRAVPECGDD